LYQFLAQWWQSDDKRWLTSDQNVYIHKTLWTNFHLNSETTTLTEKSSSTQFLINVTHRLSNAAADGSIGAAVAAPELTLDAFKALQKIRIQILVQSLM
jgi:hypothetical protein